MATDGRTVHGSGYGPQHGPLGLSIGELAASRRAARADPLRAKVEADPKIRDKEGFLVWLGRRKGGLNSHRGRSSHPGVGTKRLAGGSGSTSGPSEKPAPQLVDAPTMRLSRSDIARARVPALDAETVALRLPMSQAARAARAQPGGQWNAPKVIPRAPSTPEPERVQLPPELAKLRVGAVKLPKLGGVKTAHGTKISKRWRLGRS